MFQFKSLKSEYLKAGKIVNISMETYSDVSTFINKKTLHKDQVL